MTLVSYTGVNPVPTVLVAGLLVAIMHVVVFFVLTHRRPAFACRRANPGQCLFEANSLSV
jgi:hypothetical protein